MVISDNTIGHNRLTEEATIENSISNEDAVANFNAIAGSDYTTSNATLTFASGETSKTISISVIGNSSSRC